MLCAVPEVSRDDSLGHGVEAPGGMTDNRYGGAGGRDGRNGHGLEPLVGGVQLHYGEIVNYVMVRGLTPPSSL